MIFTKDEYDWLHGVVFSPEFSGYKPEVREAPNGDGKIDTSKRYAHVAEKYAHADMMTDAHLRGFFARAHAEARRVAQALGVPEAFMPDARRGALRVLEYPAGAGSEMHTDFDLFTILCYRNDRDHYPTWEDSPLIFMAPEGERENSKAWKRLQKASPGMHVGEIGELVGLGPATPHEVLPCSHVQHSIVYFAIPPHEAQLPTFGGSVGAWLAGRLARSRY